MATAATAGRIPLVDLHAQYSNIRPEIDAAIQGVLDRGDFILGEAVAKFEDEFAAYCGARHAIGVASGTEALRLTLLAVGIRPGDEVITTANTFIATAMAIAETGAKPVLVDCDPDTYLMDIDAAERAITPRTRAILPVHLYGLMMDLDPLIQLARDRRLKVIEDACQAHGAWLRGRRAGTIGDAGCFSFFPGKNLGAYGDAGGIVTNDGDLAERLRMMRNWGQRKKYDHVVKGYNSRLDTMQAAVLRVKLRHLDAWNDARRAHAREYDRLLAGIEALVRPDLGRQELTRHVFHQYVIRVPNRAHVARELQMHGIATGIHYPVPIHLQPPNQDLGYPKGSFPNTERFAETILSLPMFPELTIEQVARISSAVREAMAA